MRYIVYVTVALLVFPSWVTGQEPETIRSVLESIREHGSSRPAIAFLKQEKQAHPQGQLDALADSLVAMIVSVRPGDPNSRFRAAVVAGGALVFAAGPGSGTPYPRSFEMLAEVYEHSSEPGIKGGTLWMMTQLPNQGRVVDFMADVATSPGPGTAPTAVYHLANDLGPSGLARLKQLYENDLVVDATARQHLAGVAAHHGW